MITLLIVILLLLLLTGGGGYVGYRRYGSGGGIGLGGLILVLFLVFLYFRGGI